MGIFQSSSPLIDENLLSLVAPCVTDSENESFVTIPSSEEIRKVVSGMPQLKSPGSDGFPAKFYTDDWDTVGRDLILANRIRLVLEKIISPFQSAFVKGRWIAENSIIASEIVHDMGIKKGREAFMGVKCDMSKAYDRLEWNFVNEVLKAFGFSESRGLRQGDPLSPYLFILCSEILSRLILEKEKLGLIEGYRMSRNGPTVSHLMGKGLELAEVFDFELMDGNEFFLGNPLFVKGNRSKDFNFIVDKARRRMEGWKAKLLSQATRTTLIKSVISAIPTYNIVVFPIPVSITNSLDALVRHFWWKGNLEGGRYLALLNWNSMCKPKPCGGLGIRCFRDINFCFPVKLGLLEHQSPSNASLVARGIWRTREFINDNSLWLVGDGKHVNIWKKAWSCGDEIILEAGVINLLMVDKGSLKGFFSDDGTEWDVSAIVRKFRPSAAEAIISCKIEELNTMDRLVWRDSLKGEFSIKTVFRSLYSASFTVDVYCTKLWKLKFQERLKLFLWKVYRGCAPFGSIYNRIFGSYVGDCALCGVAYGDTDEHFFTSCVITCDLWWESKWGNWTDQLSPGSGKEVVKLILDPSSFPDIFQACDWEEFTLFATVLYHSLWAIRNTNYYSKVRWRVNDINDRESSLLGRWKLPRLGRIRVNVDFATGDGIGAIRVVTWDASGGIKALFALKVSLQSVTHGELEAVGKGAEVLHRLGIIEADILSDNQVVVEALSSNESLSWSDSFLFSKVCNLLSSLQAEILWILRSKNSSADALAKWELFNNYKRFLSCWEVMPCSRIGGAKFAKEMGNNQRRALSSINPNILGATHNPYVINKRDFSGKLLPAHVVQHCSEVCNRQTQNLNLLAVKSSGIEDCQIVEVEDFEDNKDVPVPMFVKHTEALLDEFDQVEEVEMEDVEDEEEDVEEEPVMDIDSSNLKDPLSVVEYVNEIYVHYRKTECLSCVSPNYMAHQPDINDKMRAILIDWLIEVHHKFELMEETLFLTVNLIDRFLERQIVIRKKLQLVGVTAMLLACKYEEVSVPVIEDFVLITDKAYTKQDVLDMEKLIVNELQFNFSVPTPFVFLRRFLQAAQSNKKLEILSSYIIELCLVEYKMLKFSPSLLAAAAIYTSQCTLCGSKQWSKTSEWYSNYSENQLLECSRLMVSFHQKAGKDKKLTGVYRKYNTKKFGFAVRAEPANFLIDGPAALCAHKGMTRNKFYWQIFVSYREYLTQVPINEDPWVLTKIHVAHILLLWSKVDKEDREHSKTLRYESSLENYRVASSMLVSSTAPSSSSCSVELVTPPSGVVPPFSHQADLNKIVYSLTPIQSMP
uniref:B-like cyclin n=1 Tax=Cannabis sativa TaxID=3483 RepID=A0A803NR40_CANSA